MPHVVRPEIKAAHPVHVTLRLVDGIESLRVKSRFLVVRKALAAGKDRLGFRLIQYSVQTNHLHLIVEASDKDALSRGMKGLQVRLARAINACSARRGRVFADRYHAHVLKTPRETRHALAYVLLNARKHASNPPPTRNVDPCSSGLSFDGWARAVYSTTSNAGTTVRANSWLLTTGWKKHKLIDPSEAPVRNKN